MLIYKEELEARVRGIIGAVGSYKSWEIMDEISKSKAVDAVPVVKCKNCIWSEHAKNGFGEDGYNCICKNSPAYENFWWLEPDWFCADGERRCSGMTDTAKIDKPKPCPFCGSKAEIEHKRALLTWIVQCSNTSCPASYMLGMDYDTEKEAIEAWNRRVTI